MALTKKTEKKVAKQAGGENVLTYEAPPVEGMTRQAYADWRAELLAGVNKATIAFLKAAQIRWMKAQKP